MTDSSWLSLLPPLLAIVLAIWSKQVYLSLFAGIFIGWTILSNWNPLLGIARALEGCITVFQDPGNTKVILFSVLVGSLITLMQASGGVSGFVIAMTEKGLVRNRKSAQLMSMFFGTVIFIESSITSLVTGAISRPIYDKYKISREKLAYICDSTAAPVCILIPLNAWGAYVLGLLEKENIEQPINIFVSAIPFNFYAILAIAIVFLTIILNKDIGPMAAAERRVAEKGLLADEGSSPIMSAGILEEEIQEKIRPRALNMMVPIVALIIMMPVSMWITGDGNIMNGSGSTSVFWSVIAAITTAALLYRFQGIFDLREITDLCIKGIGSLAPMAILMMLAFAIGDIARLLNTGEYVARIFSTTVSPSVIPMILFLGSAFIAFSTGTSFGTFGIMIPIAVPVALASGVHLPLVVAAVLGGGVFGDHCSPISDTTLVASLASATDHIDHVRTQLPYAMTAAFLSSLLFLLAGLL